jgi:hypothetical protein
MNLSSADIHVYAALYLSAGIVTLLVVLAANWHRLRPDPQSLLSLIEAANPQTKTLWYRIRAKVLGPLLGSTLMVLLWPVVPLMKLLQWWEDRRAEQRRKSDVFRVRRQHLLERLTVAQIEAREMVEDPLQAVPALPFGHLNSTWCDLVAGLAPRDECWTFSAQWNGDWRGPELRTGYVIWRSRRPVGHILTMIKRLEDLPEAASKPTASVGPLDAEEVEIPAFLSKKAD